MILALILIPAVAGLLAWLIRPHPMRRAVLVAASVVHAGLTGLAWVRPLPTMFNGWLGIDAAGLLFLTITSLLFLLASIYALGYLARQVDGQEPEREEGEILVSAPEAGFTACLLFFLSTMTLVTVSQHFGLLWVAVEATTLASAPLIYFRRQRRSLEATWKYLLICSVGIGLALLGNLFLVVAGPKTSSDTAMLLVGDLMQAGSSLNVTWLQLAFIFMLVGYGTKMGLAPLHTWLPDAHSESPSVVSALLSGALLNCAFLALLRMQQVLVSAGQGAYGQNLLVFFGLLSMAFAGVFILAQPDFKRMLAYSSVEHMGILALGVGLGGVGCFGSLLHAVNHSLTKGLLFLVAGNILAAYHSKSTLEVKGMLRALPVSGILWVVGFLAITGTPPFGPFMSELTVLRSALEQDRYYVAGVYLLLLALVFVGMATLVLRMARGELSPSQERFSSKERLTSVVPPAVLAVLTLVLGLYVPPPLWQTLEQAARLLGGR